MARQAQVEKVVPETLPVDFDHWDDGKAPPPPATLPMDFDNFDEKPTPQVRSSEQRAVAPAPETPARRTSAPPTVHSMPAPANTESPAPKRTQEPPVTRRPAKAPQQTGSISLNLREAAAAPPEALAQPSKYVSNEELSTLVEAYYATEDEDGEKQRRKNLRIRWVGAILLVLAIVAAVVFFMLQKPAKQSPGVVVVQHPVVTYTPEAAPSREPSKEKPSPAKPAQPATEKSAPAQAQ